MVFLELFFLKIYFFLKSMICIITDGFYFFYYFFILSENHNNKTTERNAVTLAKLNCWSSKQVFDSSRAKKLPSWKWKDLSKNWSRDWFSQRNLLWRVIGESKLLEDGKIEKCQIQKFWYIKRLLNCVSAQNGPPKIHEKNFDQLIIFNALFSVVQAIDECLKFKPTKN